MTDQRAQLDWFKFADGLIQQAKSYADVHSAAGPGDAGLINATASLTLYGIANALLDALDTTMDEEDYD